VISDNEIKSHAMSDIGNASPQLLTCVRPVPGLQLFWSYERSDPGLAMRLVRLRDQVFLRRPRPDHVAIVELEPAPRWVIYFVFAPDGQIDAHHDFTLRRLKDQGFKTLIICSTRERARVPAELHGVCDALYWKAVGGYDFSAYRLGLEIIAARAPGASVLLLNDSVFGPFHDLNPLVDYAPWDLTGFTANGANENHVQSYGFFFKQMDRQLLASLESVFYPSSAFDDVDAVIFSQENRMARVASACMTVGAYWYGDGKKVDDACLRCPFDLMSAGFPFLKRSLFGRMRSFQDVTLAADWLRRYGHPVPSID
jgi:hypothetical protein